MNKVLIILGLFVLLAVFTLSGIFLIRDHETLALTNDERALAAGNFIELSAGYTHYHLRGPENGPTVVLVHGVSTPNYLWNSTADTFIKEGYRVLQYDLLGRGFSDRPDVTYTKELFANQLNDLVEHLGISKPFYLAGISMGGIVVTEFSVQYPDKVSKLALLAPFNKKWDMGLARYPVLGEFLATTQIIPAMPDRLARNFYRPDLHMPKDWSQKIYQQTRYKGFRHAFLSSLRNIVSLDPIDRYRELGRTGIPTITIWGKQDATLPFEQHKRVLEVVPNSDVLLVDKAGHILHMEQPGIVNSALIEFFQ